MWKLQVQVIDTPTRNLSFRLSLIQDSEYIKKICFSPLLKSVLLNVGFVPKLHMVAIWLTSAPELNALSFNFSEKRALLYPKQIQQKP